MNHQRRHFAHYLAAAFLAAAPSVALAQSDSSSEQAPVDLAAAGDAVCPAGQYERVPTAPPGLSTSQASAIVPHLVRAERFFEGRSPRQARICASHLVTLAVAASIVAVVEVAPAPTFGGDPSDSFAPLALEASVTIPLAPTPQDSLERLIFLSYEPASDSSLDQRFLVFLERRDDGLLYTVPGPSIFPVSNDTAHVLGRDVPLSALQRLISDLAVTLQSAG
jgi:hypothetical protein